MLTKKYTIKSESKVDTLIASLINGQYDKSGTQAQLLAQSQTLKFYFSDLQQHITPNNIQLVKKYQILQDGLYVLLRGQISFKQFTSSFQNEAENRSKNINRSSSGLNYLSQTFSVFQSSMKNSTAIEDSFLLRIFQHQKLQTKFDEKFIQRKNICKNCYLSHHHGEILDNLGSLELITVDFKLHSNFGFKSYAFRQILCLKDTSIIKEGRVKFSIKGKTTELEKYALLLPEVNYEVTTSHLLLLIIYGQQPLKPKIGGDLQSKKEQKMCWFPTVNKPIFMSNNQCNEQLKSTINTKYQKVHNKKQKQKRQKQITKLSKESQSYSIISSFLCKKSLDFAKKQNGINKSRKPFQRHNQTPLVLFNFGTQKNNPRHIQRSITFGQTKTRKSQSEKQKAQEITDLNQKQNMLKKLKLPLADYQKILRKNLFSKTCSNVLISNKGKSHLTLKLAKYSSDIKQNIYSQEQEFVRYKDT